MTAIKGTYAGLKPVKTRKIWVIEIEVPEENIKHVTDIMGFPSQSESQWVGVTLMHNESSKKRDVLANSDIPQNNNELSKNEKSEGEKLRIRACCLCKEDSDFQFFASQGSKLSLNTYDWEEYCRTYICNYCNIKSRSELTTDIAAQKLFKELDQKFKGWQYEQRHKDNLDREQ